jgi:hypothetical protein
LHAALGSRRARCHHLRLAGEPVEACQVPSSDDGYYSGHIAYAWEHRGSSTTSPSTATPTSHAWPS